MKGSISAADLDDALASLQHLGGDLPARAHADALNHVGNIARQELQREMAAVFDRPSPFTINAIRIFNATPSKLECEIWVKDDKDNNSKAQAPEDWVAPQVFGGPRVDKKSESLLRAKGILPAGLFVVPATGAKLDQYGNLSRGQVIQILSGLGSAEGARGYTANATESARSLRKGHAKAFFVMRRGKTPIGIAERRGKTLVMVLAFVKQPQYRERFRFHDVVRRTAENDALMEASIDKAIARALDGRAPSRFRRGGR
ncbi:hypothetical protein D9M68_676870 [compost metagenome]